MLYNFICKPRNKVFDMENHDTSAGFEVTDEIMDQIVQSIVKVSDPEQIILFGSRAGQYYKPDSDIDLLVVSRMPYHGIKYKEYTSSKETLLDTSRELKILDTIIKTL